MVQVRGLSVSYSANGRTIQAVEALDLDVERGSICAIVGPSGCGKTSVVKALAGLLPPGGGQILVDGAPVIPGLTRAGTSVVFQDFGLLPWKTVEGNAELPLLVRGVGKRERAARAASVLGELGLADFRRFYPSQLSGGMKQRLAIARALVTEPDLLLMDEPFSSVDALTRESLQDNLRDAVARHGVTVLLVTHSIEEAAYLADRAYVMAGRVPGRMVARFEGGRDIAAVGQGISPGGRVAGLPQEPSEGLSSAPAPQGMPADDGGGGYRDSPGFHVLARKLRNALNAGADRKPTTLEQVRPGLPWKAGLGSALGAAAATGAFLGLWALAALYLRKPFLPGPAKAIHAFMAGLADGSLTVHTLASARRIGLAMLLVAPGAAALGLACGRVRTLDALLSPAIYLFYPLPKIAFLPVIMLLMGLGDASKIAVIVLIVASQVLVNARDAGKAVAEGYFDSARAMGAGALGRLRHVLVPASMPALLSALRVSLGTATAVLFFAETFATEEGLGWYIMDAWARVDYPDMFAAILALSLFGLACFALVDMAERILCRWHRRSK